MSEPESKLLDEVQQTPPPQTNNSTADEDISQDAAEFAEMLRQVATLKDAETTVDFLSEEAYRNGGEDE